VARDDPVVCPQCSQSESVARVSGVYENARASGTSRARAKQFAPPRKPLYDFIEGAWRRHEADSAGSMPVLMRLSISLIVAVLLLAITMAVFAPVFATAHFEIKDMALPVVGGGVLLFLLSLREDEEGHVTVWGPDSETSWQKGVYQWRRSRYCSRCDGVFLPGDEQLTPIRGLRSLLHKRPG
jgi:hypothetical protein